MSELRSQQEAPGQIRDFSWGNFFHNLLPLRDSDMLRFVGGHPRQKWNPCWVRF